MGRSHDLATGVSYQDLTETDARYHTKTASDALYYTQTASDAAFVAKAGDTMTGDLNVEGKLQGHNVNLENVKEWNITGSYNANHDYVFGTRTEVHALGKGSGFYKFLVFSDTYNAGISHYSVYTPYNDFFFVNQACNTNVTQTLTWPGVNFGHAANTGNRAVDIKVKHPYSSDSTYPANQQFIFMPLTGLSNLSGGAGYTLKIYMYKVA